MKQHFRLACAVLALFAVLSPQAHAQLAKTPFDWVNGWASLQPQQHTVKDSLTRALDTCAGPSVQPSDVKVFRFDMNSDGLEDYLVDLHAFKNDPALNTCDDLPCVGNDCYMWAYIKRAADPIQQITSPPAGAPACPAAAADNIGCLSHCPATLAQCPLLFRHVYDLAWNMRAESWDLYAHNTLPPGRSLAPNPNFGNVLSMTVNEMASLWKGEELAQNGGKCVKFYQWDPVLAYSRDIWRPIITMFGDWPREDLFNFTRFDQSTMRRGKGDEMGDGEGLRVDRNTRFAINTKVGDKTLCPVTCEGDIGRQTVGHGGEDGKNCYQTCYKEFDFLCVDITNNTVDDYFVPNKTPDEFSSFYHNPPAGVKTELCELRYTPWEGHEIAASFLNNARVGTPLTTDVCTMLGEIPCGTSVVVSVNRSCQASVGVFMDCGQCNGDDRINPANRALGCMQQVTCFGPTCPTTSGDGGGDGGGGGGGDCVTSETRVLLENGTTKGAEFLRVGDTVMAFKADAPGRLFPAKVKDISSRSKPTISINGFTATHGHVMVTQNRGLVPVDGVRISDILIKGDGTRETVREIGHADPMETVYTIIVDGADGYVADGLLVLAAPAALPGETVNMIGSKK